MRTLKTTQARIDWLTAARADLARRIRDVVTTEADRSAAWEAYKAYGAELDTLEDAIDELAHG